MKTITILAAVSAAALATPSQANEAWIAAVAGADRVEVKEDTNTERETDLLYGVSAGYDFLIGDWIAGPELEATLSNVHQTKSGLIVPTDELTLDLSRDLYAGLRVGHRIGPNLSLYAKAGYSNLRYGATYRVSAGAPETDHDELQGYRLGGGVEFAPGKIFGRLEYRFSDYGDHQDSGIATRRHQVAASVGYRF